MKSYVKPKLTAFSLSGNETLCGGCSNKLEDTEGLPGIVGIVTGIPDNGDGWDRDDFISYFSSAEDNCAIPTPITGSYYCKFTSTINILWS